MKRRLLNSHSFILIQDGIFNRPLFLSELFENTGLKEKKGKKKMQFKGVEGFEEKVRGIYAPVSENPQKDCITKNEKMTCNILVKISRQPK